MPTEPTFPYALIMCERSVPQPIFAAAFAKSDLKRIVQLAAGLSDDEIRHQAYELVTVILKENKGGFIGFGMALSYVINFSEGRAERFNLEGNFMEKLNENIWPGFASVSLR